MTPRSGLAAPVPWGWWWLAVLAALPVLLPWSQPPIVTAVGELAAVGSAGVVAMALGIRAWQTAPLRVAGFSALDANPQAARHSIAGPLLLGSVAVAGLGSALIALAQVLMPDQLHGAWVHFIEPSHLNGRAVGHVRQPNHLATLLLWGAVAWVAVVAAGRAQGGLALLGMGLLMWALVLSGSRTGLLGLSVLVAWGVVDRALPRLPRTLLVTSPLMAALAWLGMKAWSAATGLAFGASTHLAATTGGDISSSRFAIWRNTWTLIEQHPWTGVGWGQFNIAWTLTPMTNRPTALFDHAHNLPLHLMAEWGIPLGIAATGLALALLWGAVRRAHRAQSVWPRAASAMLWVVGLHSLLEYPLWYAYFALPSAAALAVAWGWDQPWPRAARWQAVALVIAGGLMASLAASASADYQRVRAIYAPGPGAGPLSQRMATGQHSRWFADHAHYAVATQVRPVPGQPWPPELAWAFERAPYVLLDARLMMAWADALAARNGPGDRDKARYLAARLREFNPPAAREWLGACDDPPGGLMPKPACEAPQATHHWREFLPAGS